MSHSISNVRHKQHCLERFLDQTSKESIFECAHDSGGLIGSCTSSRENCECGLCFIIERSHVGEGSYGDASHLLVIVDGTPRYVGCQAPRFGGIRTVAYEL